MSMTITLPTDLERWLREQASQRGTSAENLIEDTVRERWTAASRTKAFSPQESQLLLQIQNAFPPEETAEFHDLCRQSDAGVIEERDRPRYRELIFKRELQNVQRIKALGELAKLRGVTLDELMDTLQIGPEAV